MLGHGAHANGIGPMLAMPKILAVTAIIALAACGGGDLGDEAVERCVPEGACDEAMFQGGIKAALGHAEAGKKLFADNCVRCHLATGKGEGDAKLIDMTSPAWQASLRDSAIVKTIRAGRGTKMPAFSFSDQELRDVLAHLRTLEVRPKPAAREGGY